MKIAYIQDSHIKGTNSINYIGNYYEDCMNQLESFLKLAKKNKCDCLIHGGDVWENPVVSNLMVDEFIDLIEKYKIPLYVVWGNHDQIGQNIETSKGSSLAHCFRRSKLINHLVELDHKIFKSKEEFTISSFDYEYEIEEQLKKYKLNKFTYKGKERFTVYILHAFVTPKPFLPEVSHIVCEDIKGNADLVLVAHYHEPWEKKVGDTTFLDIGCFGRLNINEAKIKPSMCLIDTDKKSWEVIEIPHKPGNEIFDLKKHKDKKDFKKDMNKFFSSLKSSKINKFQVKDIITKICKEQKIDKNVKNIIMENL